MELLEKHFNTAFAAPDSVEKLRELILILAMQGKLVPQKTCDLSASKILQEIAVKKQQLIKEGVYREKADQESLKETESSLLPQKWLWCTIRDLGFVLGGKRLPKGHSYAESPTAYRYITVTNMKSNTIVDNEIKFIRPETHNEISKYIITKNDLYITIAGTIGAVGSVPEMCDGMNLTENAARLVFFECDKTFLLYLMNSPIVQGQFSALTNKMAQPKLSLRSILSTSIPIPPLAEQRRIVAKIDQLMARCDELEKLRAERDRLQVTVHKVACDRLLTAKDPDTFTQSWQFITQHFTELYSVKENVTELRKAILQIAVMGKVVSQKCKDSPASELVKKITTEKQKLIKEKRIRKPKQLPEITTEEAPHELPQGWALIRFGELTTEIATGPFGAVIHKSEYVENGIPLINPSHMINGVIVHDPAVTVTKQKAKELDSHKLFADDIVMARRGEMGRCAVVDEDSEHWLCGTGSFVLRFIPDINRHYIQILFRTESVRAYLGGKSVGTTMTNLNHGILNKMPLMLPPTPEQSRIVAKVDQLMTLCDTLEQQIDATTQKQTALLNAVINQI